MKNLSAALLTLFLCFGISLPGISQKHNTEGVIINLQNDSIKGLIDFREWNSNPDKILFTAEDGSEKTYTPYQIRGFVIPSKERYIAERVSLDVTSEKTEDLMNEQGPKVVKDTCLFLRVVVRGEVSLYYFNDLNDRSHYYIAKQNDRPVELIQRKNYKTLTDGSAYSKSYITTLDLFKGQMILLFQDCPELKEAINRSSFTTSSLGSLVIRYNQCKQYAVSYVQKEDKTKFKIGILAGPTFVTSLIFSKISDNIEDQLDVSGLKLHASTGFTAGISLHFNFARNFNCWSLVNELVYRQYSAKGTKNTPRGWFTYEQNYQFTFNLSYLKLNTLCRYQFPKWKIQPFAEIGMSNGFLTKESNSETKTTIKQDHTSKSITKNALDEIRKYEFGLVGGLGAMWNKLGVSLRYERAQGISPYDYVSCPENSISVMVSYIF
ncbi:MAG: porin family protein [Bacteroidota bacterium]|nr:porin family protein [Bacteroidota bacterium]